MVANRVIDRKVGGSHRFWVVIGIELFLCKSFLVAKQRRYGGPRDADAFWRLLGTAGLFGDDLIIGRGDGCGELGYLR